MHALSVSIRNDLVDLPVPDLFIAMCLVPEWRVLRDQSDGLQGKGVLTDLVVEDGAPQMPGGLEDLELIGLLRRPSLPEWSVVCDVLVPEEALVAPACPSPREVSADQERQGVPPQPLPQLEWTPVQAAFKSCESGSKLQPGSRLFFQDLQQGRAQVEKVVDVYQELRELDQGSNVLWRVALGQSCRAPKPPESGADESAGQDSVCKASTSRECRCHGGHWHWRSGTVIKFPPVESTARK